MAIKREPWKTDDFWVSHWDFNQGVTRDFKIPKLVKAHDSTLRDGVQEPGITLDLDDTLRIAEKLAEVGVHRIEIGHGGGSPEEEKTIKEVVKRNLGPEILTFCGSRKDMIDKAIDCGVTGVLMPVFSSEYEVQSVGRPVEAIISGAIEGTIYAHEKGLWVTLFTIDATRAGEDFYFDLVEKVNKDGYFDALCLADTRGVLNPQAVVYLVNKLKEKINKSVEIHVHNNFGLAVANTIAGVLAGSDIIHTTINGVGASAGNCPLTEVSVALKALYGVDIGIKYNKLIELTRLGAELLGREVPSMRPLVGDMIYAVEAERMAGLQRNAERQGKEFSMLNEHPIKPEFVGQAPGQRIVMGRKSGRANVEIWAEEINIKLTDEEVAAAMAEVRKKATEVKRLLTKDEFRAIAERVKAV